MKNLLLLICLSFAVVFMSAKKDPEYVKNWKLVSMNGVDVKQECSMKITPGGTFVGKGFCNNFTGNLAFDGKRKVTCNQNIAATKKMCNEGMEVENEFMNTLKKVDSYEIDDDMLMFKTEKQTTLVFKRIIEPKKTKKQIKEEAEAAEKKAKEDKIKAEQKAKEDKAKAEQAAKDAKEAKKKKK